MNRSEIVETLKRAHANTNVFDPDEDGETLRALEAEGIVTLEEEPGPCGIGPFLRARLVS